MIYLPIREEKDSKATLATQIFTAWSCHKADVFTEMVHLLTIHMLFANSFDKLIMLDLFLINLMKIATTMNH
jgi:hypothetical protein